MILWSTDAHWDSTPTGLILACYPRMGPLNATSVAEIVSGAPDLHTSEPESASQPDFRILVAPPLAVILWLAPRPTIQLCSAAFAQLLAHPEFKPHFGIVSDWRRARMDAAPHFGRDFLTALATLQQEGAFSGRWATVVPAAAKMASLYGVGRTVEIFGRSIGLRYQVFVNYDDAVTWAGSTKTPEFPA